MNEDDSCKDLLEYEKFHLRKDSSIDSMLSGSSYDSNRVTSTFNILKSRSNEKFNADATSKDRFNPEPILNVNDNNFNPKAESVAANNKEMKSKFL